MKLIFCIFLLLFLSCKTSKITSSVSSTPLNNYIVRSNLDQNEIGYFYILNESRFLQYFTLSRSAPGSNVFIPNFDNQIVIGMILPLTTLLIDLKLRKVTTQGKDLNVYYDETIESGSTFSHNPFAVAAIQKNRTIRSVNFYKNGALINSIHTADEQ